MAAAAPSAASPGPAILAFDIGTSSTRALLYDAETGRLLPGAVASARHDPDDTADGGSTLDPEALVREAMECARQALRHSGGATVVAVAGCTFWHSVLGVDAAGRPTTPVLLWSDRRSAEQVARLRQTADPSAYTQRTGCPLHTSYLPGRLLWLAETDPDAFAASVRLLSPAEYLFARLFGLDRAACSHSMASATGLMNQRDDAWDAETLALVPGLAADRLSPISDAAVSGLLPEWRAEMPELAEVPWYPFFGDGACSNLGCGATGPDSVALMIGTSGAMRVVAPRAAGLPPVPAGLWRYEADADRCLLGGALSNGGSVWAWLVATLHMPGLTPQALDETLKAMPPDAHGLTVLPFLSGERAPLWRDDLTAAVVGMTQATTSLDIARAHLEAVAYRFAAIRERLRAVAPRARLIGTGAALRHSEAWAHILADVLGEPITLSEEPEASSRGAMLLVRERLGLGPLESAETRLGVTFEPDEATADAYAEARARHEALMEKLEGTASEPAPPALRATPSLSGEGGGKGTQAGR